MRLVCWTWCWKNGEPEVITLDSGADVHVWPRGLCEEVPVLLEVGLRMCAENGTPIPNLGRKLSKFGGVALSGEQVGRSGFTSRLGSVVWSSHGRMRRKTSDASGGLGGGCHLRRIPW